MAKRQEMIEMLRDAAEQGFTWVVAGSGHYMVTAPTGETFPVANTPNSDAAVRSQRSKLKRHGYLPPRHRNRKKKNKQQQKDQLLGGLLSAVDPPAPPSPSSPIQDHHDTGKEADAMPEVRDMARISRTPAKPSDVARTRQALTQREDIRANITQAGELVWTLIIEKINSGKTPAESMSAPDGTPGFKWAYSRSDILNEIWPGLVQQAYGVRKVDPVVGDLARYLKRSRNMMLLQQGNPTQVSVWWVSAKWNPAPRTVLSQTKDQANEWWEKKVTPQEAGEDREPAPVETSYVEGFEPEPLADQSEAETVPEKPSLFREQGDSTPLPPRQSMPLPHPPNEASLMVKCPQCEFFDMPLSVGTHQGRLSFSGRPHGDGMFPCPLCPRVRTAPDSLDNHMRKDHPDATIFPCRHCGRMFRDMKRRRRHMHQEHSIFAKGPEEEITHDTAEALATGLVSEVDTSAVPGDAVEWFTQLLMDYTRLKEAQTLDTANLDAERAVWGEERERLLARVDTLTTENTELKDRVSELADALLEMRTSLKSLLGEPQD